MEVLENDLVETFSTALYGVTTRGLTTTKKIVPRNTKFSGLQLTSMETK